MIDKDVDLLINGAVQAAPVYPPVNPAIHTLGWKKYEITNYLGNVNAVITDRKVFVGGSYEAVVIMNSDYYPFGMEMPNRHTNEGQYRFGYNGMEMDNEAKGNGNSYTTEFRQYDPRLGRWLSLDPLMVKYPNWSPYNYCLNNPIVYIDRRGDDPITAVLEAVTSFGLSVGMSFIENIYVKDMSIPAAVDNIEWGSAFIDAGVTFLMSAFVSGSGTSTKLARMANSRTGRITIAVVKEFVSGVVANYFNGDYNDADGDFSFDLFKSSLKTEFMKSVAGVFIDEKLTKQADKILDYYRISSKSLSKNRQKRLKNYRSKAEPNIKKKAIENREKKIKNDKKEKRKQAVKYVLAETPAAVVGKAAEVTIDPPVLEYKRIKKDGLVQSVGYHYDSNLYTGEKWVYDDSGILKEIQIWEKGKDTGKKGNLEINK